MKSATDIHGVATPWRLFEGYQPLEGTYDEMVAAPGVLRPHCEGFARSLEALGQHEFASRLEGAKRTIRENGVTYNIYGDPEGVDRPWELDMVPLAHLAGGVGAPRDGPGSADDAAQSDPGRPVWPADIAGRRAAAALARVLEPRVPAAVPRHSRPAWHSPPSACGGPGAIARRSMVGACRPHAGAVGRRICARKSHRDLPQPARNVPRLPGATPGLLLSRATRRLDDAGAVSSATSRRSCC